MFKDINGYEGLYKINKNGDILSVKRNNKLKLNTDGNGYIKVRLYKNNNTKYFKLHRLLATHFITNPNNLKCVNHIDGNTLNNKLDNLEWVSQRENMCHSQINRKSTSKYIGVCFVKSKGKWVATIYIDKKLIFLGYFNSEVEAYNSRLKFEKENNIVNKYNKIEKIRHKLYTNL